MINSNNIEKYKDIFTEVKINNRNHAKEILRDNEHATLVVTRTGTDDIRYICKYFEGNYVGNEALCRGTSRIDLLNVLRRIHYNDDAEIFLIRYGPLQYAVDRTRGWQTIDGRWNTYFHNSLVSDFTYRLHTVTRNTEIISAVKVP